MAAVLAGFWLWGELEKFLDSNRLRHVEPIKVPDKPTYHPNRDVSIIVPTINTPDGFVRSLATWLAADPLEIIIVTIPRDVARVQELVKAAAAEAEAKQGDSRSIDIVSVQTVPEANKRRQLAHGAKQAKGRIVCFADDDVLWPSPRFLTSLIACFEDPSVGGAGGNHRPHVPPGRRDPDVITPWEVAAIKRFGGVNGDQATYLALEATTFTLAGRTAAYRAEVVQDAAFLRAFTSDYWGFGKGQLLNSGDDVFCTRWTQDHGWKIAVQGHEDAQLLAHIHPDSSFAWQSLRWWRNTMRSNLRGVFVTRRAWASSRTIRKTLLALMRPIFSAILIWAWIQTILTRPLAAFGFAILYSRATALDLYSFAQKNPYCTRYLWAALLADYAYLVLDPWAWLTLGNTGWLTRDSSLDEKHVEQAPDSEGDAEEEGGH